MNPEIKIILQLAHMEIFEPQRRSESDLKAWLANMDYLMYSSLSAKDTFELKYNSKGYIYAALANDCNRFAQAAIESVASVQTEQKLPRSTAWSVVKIYYASFFAVHAILRIFGRSCSQLEKEHVKKVYELAIATGQEGGLTGLEHGFYFSKIDRNLGTISFHKMKDSHADTWASFNKLLCDLIDDIPSNTTGLSQQKVDAVDLLSKIKNLTSRSRANRGNWLSVIRNQVNYQHTHGTWFPYNNSSYSTELVNRNMLWKNSPISFDGDITKGDIEVFFNAANCIVSFLHKLLISGFEKGDRKSSVLQNGTFRLIHLLETT